MINVSEPSSSPRAGYDPETVDIFLQGVADEVRDLLTELRSEGVRVRTLERELTELQVSHTDVSGVFLSAAEAKSRLLEAAEKQADEILANARRDAKTGGVSPFIQALEEAEAIEAAALAIAERMKADAAAAARKIVEQARSAAANVEVMVDVVDLSATQSGHRASSESLQ
ncbi:MAG: DivIVA domain-containing protein [Acidimicrobiia bacterium]|nr:DivIVA domain-containing protein [Acidimicrobiia bacterium]